MRDVMIDIEAWGTGTLALPLSIGAVEFDLTTGTIPRTFEVKIDPINAQKCGFCIDAQTVDWWMQQSDEARASLRGRRISVVRAFDELTQFLRTDRGEPIRCRVWGNGSNFDNRIIREGYDHLGIKCPWHYRDDRDMRTFMAMMKKLGATDDRVKVDPPTIKHSALADAEFQARLMIAYWRQVQPCQEIDDALHQTG